MAGEEITNIIATVAAAAASVGATLAAIPTVVIIGGMVTVVAGVYF